MARSAHPVNRSGRLSGSSGFSVIELVVVVGIMATLTAIATLALHTMNDKYAVENETRQMQADFAGFRTNAMTTRKNGAIILNPTNYAFVSYSSEGDPNGKQQAAAKLLAYPIQQLASDGSLSAFNNTVVGIDARGCLSGTASPFTIAVAPGITGPAVNGVVLQTAKTNVGAIQGGSCVLN